MRFIEIEKKSFVMLLLLLLYMVFPRLRERVILQAEQKEEQKIMDEIYAARKKRFGLGRKATE